MRSKVEEQGGGGREGRGLPRKWSAAVAGALLLFGCGGAGGKPASPGTGDLELRYAMPQASGEEIPYRVYLPSTWTPERQWPLVMVLHGYSGNAASPFQDAGGLLQKLSERHGFIVASPNGYSGMADYGANLPLPSKLDRPGPPAKMPPQVESALAEADVRNVLQRVTADYNIDRKRIYLMGNSMGMTGVLHFASAEPQRWCAISASGGPPWPNYPVERLKPISGVLLVHGALDDLARGSMPACNWSRMERMGTPGCGTCPRRSTSSSKSGAIELIGTPAPAAAANLCDSTGGL
jgi:poly(3-hydroxybutyrate) depolymerase